MKEVENCTGKDKKNGFNLFCNFWRSYLWPWKKWLEDLQPLQRFIPNPCNTASNSKLIQNPGYNKNL
jgi:hypothetical protein